MAEELQGEESIVRWYFEKRGIEIPDMESAGLRSNVATCEECYCSSGETTLYVKVSSGDAKKMKDFGFMEKEPPFEA